MTPIPQRSLRVAVRVGAASLLSALTLATPARASVNSYQDSAAFNAALAGLVVSGFDFESVAAGTVYAAGTGPAGASFTLDAAAGGATPMVADTFWTTSGTHYLGLDNADTQYQTGDSLSFSFAAPVRAFGVFVIGGSDLAAGDVALSAGSASVALNTAERTDGNGSFAYYVGLVADSAGSAFSSATLSGVSAYYVLFALDDVTLASVPEPATGLMALAGLAALGLATRRRLAHSTCRAAEGVKP